MQHGTSESGYRKEIWIMIHAVMLLLDQFADLISRNSDRQQTWGQVTHSPTIWRIKMAHVEGLRKITQYINSQYHFKV